MSEEKLEEVKTQQAMTAKQIKKLAKPEFAANPDKFYPTQTLRKLGFERATCSRDGCGNNFWRHNKKKQTCGDSQCEKKYGFIGVGTGRGKKGKKITYAEAWEGFRKSLTTARVPCTAIPRYPVVARWRSDVDYVAAGIFCFQPYCVTGELEPPANPLIQPQFCLRFNDLDNIGLTGRHYSGFIMLGIQVFNMPNKFKFWMDECVEFNYRWLTEELGIDPDEITFIEDVWAGGGNLGPSIEYFVSGLELGNMVFMQFKTFPDGHREPLKVRVIDVGIGLERVPWLINGSPTSYCDVFPRALEFLLKKLNLSIDNKVWEKFGPVSCLLNADEAANLEETWQYIADQCDMDKDGVKKAIEVIRDAYVVLDHTRCVLMAVTDGSLPSNVGGAANIRNVLRKVFAVLKTRGWMKLNAACEPLEGSVLTMDDFLHIFEEHKEDLATIYGKFNKYDSFAEVIRLEYTRYMTTDDKQKSQLSQLKKKRPDGKLTIDEWIVCLDSYGIPVEEVAKYFNIVVPGNLYVEMAERKEQQVPVMPTVLYSTEHLAETTPMYYRDNGLSEFDAKILEVIPDVEKSEKPLSIVILDQSVFYPTSGGQEHDVGELVIKGVTYKVYDATKVGPCVLHYIQPPLPGDKPDSWKDVRVHGRVDMTRREQLRNNHTATHIVYASCRKVLGPHVWQNGAKKSVDQAHLDITHFRSLTNEEVIEIQKEANRIVQRCREITKGFMPKDEAEKRYGFHLYQGGVVPGNELRVVDINGTDTEACCGTHCDNTAEVGNIKILRTTRIADGIVRLYYVAGEKAIEANAGDEQLLRDLVQSWQISGKGDIATSAAKFFDGYKKFSTQAKKQSQKVTELQVKSFLLDPTHSKVVIRSEAENVGEYIALMANYAEKFKAGGKSLVFVGQDFCYGLCGDASVVDPKEIEAEILKDPAELKASKKKERGFEREAKVESKQGPKKTPKLNAATSVGKGKNAVTGISQFTLLNLYPGHKLFEHFVSKGFTPDE